MNILPAVEHDDDLVYHRRMAYTMWEKANELTQTKNAIAVSHRRGGWNTAEWDFDSYISFVISTNFGFGSASYFDITYKYRNLVLASFSHFIKYKNSTYASVMRCTKSYPLNYSFWENLMLDCIDFYNSLVAKNREYVFEWLNEQLKVLCNGLEGFVNNRTWTFEGLTFGISNKTEITGDDFWILKADKIAQSILFITNIKELPIEVHIEQYVNRIIGVANSFHPVLKRKIDSVKRRETNALKKLEDSRKELIKIIRIETKYYPHRKVGIRRIIRGRVNDAKSNNLGYSAFSWRRKSQEKYIQELNLKCHETNDKYKDVLKIQKLLELLKNSIDELDKNLTKL